MKPGLACTTCGRTTFAMFTMAAGNGKPTFVLCHPCWLEGIKSKKQDDEGEVDGPHVDR